MKTIRATFDANEIVLYQAYSPQIADAALAAQRFVSPFSMTRMTWVKPSFAWMMERCGWATKVNQERVLAVRMKRTSFDELVAMAVPTTFDAQIDASPEAWQARLKAVAVRVQWDPERTLRGTELPYRSIQLGLRASMLAERVTRIEDLTPLVHELRALREAQQFDQLALRAPVERMYAEHFRNPDS